MMQAFIYFTFAFCQKEWVATNPYACIHLGDYASSRADAAYIRINAYDIDKGQLYCLLHGVTKIWP